MIQKLQNNDIEIARKMQIVFNASYAIEAALLKVDNFPPLQRQIPAYMGTETDFYGFWKNEELAAVVELHLDPKQIHIQSLVVDPNYFRQGIARKLVQFVFDSFSSELYMVETGSDNGPAIALYKRLEFKEVLQYNTEHGIRKVRFEKRG